MRQESSSVQNNAVGNQTRRRIALYFLRAKGNKWKALYELQRFVEECQGSGLELKAVPFPLTSYNILMLATAESEADLYGTLAKLESRFRKGGCIKELTVFLVKGHVISEP